MIELWAHQKKAFKKICEMSQSGCRRIATVAPTGSGKFYIAMKIVEARPFDKGLFITPSNVIGDAQKRQFEKDYPNDSHLFERFQTMTFAGLSRLSDEEMAQLNIDYIVMDEFHHVGADVWGDGVERLMEAQGIGTSEKPKQLFGFSATPFRPSDGGRDMGEELFHDNYAMKMFLSDAWNDPDIPLQAPKIVSTIFEGEGILAEARKSMERTKKVSEKLYAEQKKEYEQLRRHLEQSVGVEEVLDENLPKKDGRYIFFCKNIEHLGLMKEKMAEWLKSVRGLRGYTFYEIHSENNDLGVLERFEKDDSSKLKVIFAVNMLTEGVHCDCDGIILSRPTGSFNVFMQQLGRAMEVGSNKTSVVIDLVNNLTDSQSVIIQMKKKIKAYADEIEGDAGASEKSSVGQFKVGARTLMFSETLDKIQALEHQSYVLPEALLKEWNYEKNKGIDPFNVTISSPKKVWWVCDKGHEWEASPAMRAKGQGCDYCELRKPIVGVTDLATTHPELAAQWHPTKNDHL